MPRPRRIAAATLIGGSATLSGFYGFLIGEAILARRAIGTTDDRPPSPDGIYGDDLPGRTIRVLVLGDSAAVGYGVTRADATPSAMIGVGLAHVMDAPVEVQCRAVVGAQTSDLMGQIDLDPDWRPDVAVIVVGTNDVTHRVTPQASARMLGQVVRRLDPAHVSEVGDEFAHAATLGVRKATSLTSPVRVFRSYGRRKMTVCLAPVVSLPPL